MVPAGRYLYPAAVVAYMVDSPVHRWHWSTVPVPVPVSVPVPEPHVAGLLAAIALHLVRPWRLTDHRRLAPAAGVSLAAAGIALAGWAVQAVGDADCGTPTALVTTGPYAFSRNPMYVAWTLLYAGVGLTINTAWVFLVAPPVLATTHSVVRREERELERTLGEDYRDYRREVPRYL